MVSEQGAERSRTIHSRVKQISFKHDEGQKNLDRSDKPTARKEGEPRVNDQERDGEHGAGLKQNCEIPGNTGKEGEVSRAMMQERASERRTESEDARFRWVEASTEWEGAMRTMEESVKGHFMWAKRQEVIGKDLVECAWKISRETTTGWQTKKVRGAPGGHIEVVCGVLGSGHLPQGYPPSSSADSVETSPSLWASVIPESTTWELKISKNGEWKTPSSESRLPNREEQVGGWVTGPYASHFSVNRGRHVGLIVMEWCAEANKYRCMRCGRGCVTT